MLESCSKVMEAFRRWAQLEQMDGRSDEEQQQKSPLIYQDTQHVEIQQEIVTQRNTTVKMTSPTGYWQSVSDTDSEWMSQQYSPVFPQRGPPTARSGYVHHGGLHTGRSHDGLPVSGQKKSNVTMIHSQHLLGLFGPFVNIHWWLLLHRVWWWD